MCGTPIKIRDLLDMLGFPFLSGLCKIVSR